jgi:DNA polymerase I
LYLNHQDLSKYFVIDIETDKLDAERIWCICVTNVSTDTNNSFIYPYFDRAELLELLNDPLVILVGHNALSFDIPIINRLLGLHIPVSRVVDTLILSYLYNPVLPDGHSLEAWGNRLGYPKNLFNDFTKFSPELLERCEQDVRITKELFLQLTKKMKGIGYSEKSCRLEHRIRHIINKQERNGFCFDVAGANGLYSELRRCENELATDIQELFPPHLELVKEFTIKTRQDGNLYASFGRHQSKYPKVVVNGDKGTYSCFDWKPFDLASPKQRVEKLLGLGWKPLSFTPKGSPKVDEDSLVAASQSLGEPKLQALADWLVVNGRANMINTWLGAVQPDGRIHGEVFSCGAASRRMRHRKPNTANIPSNEAKYGREVRSLWRASPGRVLVGYDAKGTQMRILAHYLGGSREVLQLLCEGDPHQLYADAIGISRRTMKTVFYAFIFGAMDKKLGLVAGKDEAFGAFIRKILYDKTPGLQTLVSSVQHEWTSRVGRLLCIDGGFVLCPKPSSALNYKIQSAEACLMKLAAIKLDRLIRQNGWDCWKVGDIHDEAQLDCTPEHAEAVGTAACQCVELAGRELGFKVPMAGNYKIGATWAETH